MAKRKKSSAMKVVHKNPNQPVLVAGKKKHKVGAASPFASSSSKKSGSAAIKNALDQTHTITAVGAAAALGYLEGQGTVLPESLNMLGIGKAGVLAIAAFAGAKMLKNRTLDHVATGLGSVAAYNLAFDTAKGVPGRVSGLLQNEQRGVYREPIHGVEDYEAW